MSSIKFCRDVHFLREGFFDQRINGTFSDLDVICRDGRLKLHQFLFASASPLLREILSNPRVHQEDSATLILPDFSKSQVLTLVQYLYSSSEVKLEPWKSDLLECLRIGGRYDKIRELESKKLLSVTIEKIPKATPVPEKAGNSNPKNKTGNLNFFIIKQESKNEEEKQPNIPETVQRILKRTQRKLPTGISIVNVTSNKSSLSIINAKSLTNKQQNWTQLDSNKTPESSNQEFPESSGDTDEEPQRKVTKKPAQNSTPSRISVKSPVNDEDSSLENAVYDSSEDDEAETEEDKDMINVEARRRGQKMRFVQLKDGKWKCLLCKETFLQVELFTEHFKQMHSDRTKNSMMETTDETSQKDKESQSGFTETPGGGWKCNNCQIFFSHRFKMKHHLCYFTQDQSNDPELDLTLFECGGCFTPFVNRSHLLHHLNSTEKDCQEKTFPCERCDNVLYDKESFNFHIMRHEKKFQCEHCSKILLFPESYLNHWKLKHKLVKREHKCHICQLVFSYKKILAKHLLDHGIKGSHPCKLCDKVFTCTSALSHHKKQHTDPASLQCKKCPRSFSSIKGLKYHLNVHDGIADFLCQDCGKGFITRQKLLNHRRAIHTFEKPYFCDLCGMTFGHSDKLKVHQRRAHTGERPYMCSQCDWRGVDSSSLVHHRKRHENRK